MSHKATALVRIAWELYKKEYNKLTYEEQQKVLDTYYDWF